MTLLPNFNLDLSWIQLILFTIVTIGSFSLILLSTKNAIKAGKAIATIIGGVISAEIATNITSKVKNKIENKGTEGNSSNNDNYTNNNNNNENKIKLNFTNSYKYCFLFPFLLEKLPLNNTPPSDLSNSGLESLFYQYLQATTFLHIIVLLGFINITVYVLIIYLIKYYNIEEKYSKYIKIINYIKISNIFFIVFEFILVLSTQIFIVGTNLYLILNL